MPQPSRAFLLAALILLSACAAPRQSAPVLPGGGPDLNPVGSFQYQMTYNDPSARVAQIVTGRIRIGGEEGRYTGEISGTGTSAYPITHVSVSRNEMRVQARTEDGPVTLYLVFVGDNFSGEWEAANARRHALRGVRN